MLGGGVTGAEPGAELAHHAAGNDNISLSPLNHGGQHFAGDGYRAEKINFHHFTYHVHSGIYRFRTLADSTIIKEQVNGSVPVHGFPGFGRNSVGPAEIKR